MGQHPPLDAPIDNIKNRVDDGSHIECTFTAARFSRWNQIFEKIPFGIGEVGRI